MNEKQHKQLQGTVVSRSGDKTVVVLVKRFMRHPRYEKFITRSKKYKAHDADNSVMVGETVMIESTRPISKDKHFKVIR
ncbi:MAG: 30S ribosomal protein S17 [Candidatus Vogelbacteria bacterium]|nr:30S ribosomal protein S17 [Candidatus Vogelbacteria bacterium]